MNTCIIFRFISQSYQIRMNWSPFGKRFPHIRNCVIWYESLLCTEMIKFRCLWPRNILCDLYWSFCLLLIKCIPCIFNKWLSFSGSLWLEKDNIIQEIIISNTFIFTWVFLLLLYADIFIWDIMTVLWEISININMFAYLPSFVNGLHTFAVAVVG